MPAGISTILPVFLREPDSSAVSALLHAVDSVLSQDCSGLPLELLVVDDGSEPSIDNVPGLTAALGRPQVRLVHLRRNRGLSYALNAGLAQARYDLIARIDADDRWRPGKLAKQLAMFETDPELTLVASSMRLVHGGHPELDRDELRGGDWAGVLDLTNRIGCPFPHGSILGRRAVFMRLGGYPQNAASQHAEDYALWAQWIRFFKVAICPEIFLDYTISDRQISSVHATAQRRASVAAAAPLEALQNRSLVPQTLRKMVNSLGLDLARTSQVLFTAWRFYSHILADDEQYDAAVTLLPDRSVHRCGDADTLLADRFFYLQRGPFDRSKLPRGARSIHTASNLLNSSTLWT